jgi:hypothetical protein
MAAWTERWRRRCWPPRRRARSPVGERAAVERLSGGARFARRWGPRPLHVSVRAVRAQGGTGGGRDGEVGAHR